MFRRKKSDDATGTDGTDGTDEPAAPEQDAAAAEPAAGAASDGPRDVGDVDLEDGVERIDLSGLLIVPPADLDVQLQVDEASGEVAAVLLAGQEGAVELRPFAAPRNGDVWDDVRRQVAAEVARRGGTATEQEGPQGTELKVSLLVNLPDGGTATQISRVVGFAGPRWLVRATMFGRPAVEHRPDGDVERALRDVVVVRGSTPLAPGETLTLTVPPSAQRIEPDGS